MTEAVKYKPMSKAQQFALLAEGLGWEVKRKKEGERRSVQAKRGEERYVLHWDISSLGRQRFVKGSHFVGTVRTPVGLVKAAEEGLASLPQTMRTHANGETSALPFDPYESTKTEILAAIGGRKITWRNSISGELDSAIVPRGGIHLTLATQADGKRVVTFLERYSGFRSVDVAQIREVS